MKPGIYAIVSYLPGELARFVDSLRRELNPQYADRAAHVTVLPLRQLDGEDRAVEHIRECCAGFQPFEAEVIGVGDFLPVSNVVYLRLGKGVGELQRLHEALNGGWFSRPEEHPYVPHVTVIQDVDEANTRRLEETVAQSLAAYTGPRLFRIDRLTFVSQRAEGRWENVVQVRLGE